MCENDLKSGAYRLDLKLGTGAMKEGHLQTPIMVGECGIPTIVDSCMSGTNVSLKWPSKRHFYMLKTVISRL